METAILKHWVAVPLHCQSSHAAFTLCGFFFLSGGAAETAISVLALGEMQACLAAVVSDCSDVY